MVTAGRTVVFSATTVALSMAVLVLFPMHFLKSFAYAGVATVAFAAAAAIVVTPAALVLLGDRLDSLDVRRLARRMLGRPEPQPVPVEQRFWYRSARCVMHKAIPLGLGGCRAAASARRAVPQRAMGIPRRSRAAEFGLRSPSRRPVATRLRHQLRHRGDRRRSRHRRRQRLRHRPIRRRPVSGARRLRGVRPDRNIRRRQPRRTAVGSDRTGLRQRLPHRRQHRSVVLRLVGSPARPPARGARAPPAVHVDMTGTAQVNRDSVDAITTRLPLVLGLIAVIMFVLLFLLTGSIVVPLKALVLNVLSLTAAFGAMVWIFQDGHLGALGTTPTGTWWPTCRCCCSASRSACRWTTRCSWSPGSASSGWRRAGRAPTATRAWPSASPTPDVIITAAALIMSISFAALIAAEVAVMRLFGLGLTLAILVDATLVRMVLVPAFMHVMGQWNWWAPGLAGSGARPPRLRRRPPAGRAAHLRGACQTLTRSLRSRTDRPGRSTCPKYECYECHCRRTWGTAPEPVHPGRDHRCVRRGSRLRRARGGRARPARHAKVDTRHFVLPIDQYLDARRLRRNQRPLHRARRGTGLRGLVGRARGGRPAAQRRRRDRHDDGDRRGGAVAGRPHRRAPGPAARRAVACRSSAWAAWPARRASRGCTTICAAHPTTSPRWCPSSCVR